MIQTLGSGSPEEPGEILATASDLGQASLQQPDPPEVDWQTAMKRAIRSSSQLRRMLGLPAEPNAAAAVSFPTFVPLEFLRRIRPGDENDPLLRQVLPSGDESIHQDGFRADPVGDLDSIVADRLLQKYDRRALVIATGACGVHCRYCFRREFPYQAQSSQGQPPGENWRAAIDYIAGHEEIDEVLLSGGDPLTLVDETLFRLIEAIEAIGHVQRLRIHTRMPIVIPQRVTEVLASRLAASRLAVWVVVHANHPHELDEMVMRRLSLLVDKGIPLLNQAVLLRGVNDDAETMIQLCRRLVDNRIMPYYLHQLDRVAGAAHFEVPVSQGRRLMQQVRASLPGYAVPQYVVERPGERSKTPLFS